MTFYPSHYRIVASVGLAAALAAVPAFAASAAAADDVTLAGCLVKAEGDGNPYLLINTPAQPALNQTPSKPDVSPSGVGTTAEFRTVFYWLEGDRELKPHVGHRVEVEGDLDDADPGEIKIERKDRWTELTVKSHGDSLKAEVPHESVLGGQDDKRKGDVVVRRVKVEKVKMLGATCEP